MYSMHMCFCTVASATVPPCFQAFLLSCPRDPRSTSSHTHTLGHVLHSLVHGKSGGTVGYVHVPDMDEAGFAEFHRLFLLESQREALIVDIRWNEGGLGRCITATWTWICRCSPAWPASAVIPL